MLDPDVVILTKVKFTAFLLAKYTRCPLTSARVALGLRSRYWAIRPVTRGVACDVPVSNLQFTNGST